jgi:26S proteasome regulatory subunit N12
LTSLWMGSVELELLPPVAHEHTCIKHAVELEQSFMEGAYNRVLSARQAVPHETYVYFMDLLAKTVRYDKLLSLNL